MSQDAAYRLRSPATDIPVMEGGLRWSPDVIDYKGHKAYAADVARAGFAARLSATLYFLRSLGFVITKRLIRYEMIPLEARSPKGAWGWLRFGGYALRNLLRLDGAAPVRLEHGIAGDIYERLKATGCAVVAIPDTDFTRIEKASQPRFAALRTQRGTGANGGRDFAESRSTARRDTDPELFASIGATLLESGVMDAASKYLGRQARLVDVNPQINDKTDDFWRETFPDLNATLPPTAYFHRDASGGDLKAIFYMSDVAPDNGPFTYVLGSNRVRISKLDDLICEANDHNGLSGTRPEARRKFSALPRLFRQKGTFGDDLPEDSALSDAIRRSQWPITSAKGSIVLFDTKGTHRGGMVVEGERLVITCVIG
jgi:hypothetical protein